MQTTSNYSLKKPDGTDVVDISQLNSNMDILDAALTPTADPAQVPSGLSGNISQWVSWITNRIKAITGKTNWYDAPAKNMLEMTNDITQLTSDVNTHKSDSAKHVSKDGTLQTGLNAQIINGVYFRNNSGLLEWSINNTSWNQTSTPAINLLSEISLVLDATNTAINGTKKTDALTVKGQCSYLNTSTSTNTVWIQSVLNNLRFGSYSAMIRLRSANNTLATDAIRVEVQKNVSGTYSTIKTRNIKANEFLTVNAYQCFYVPFEYNGALATNNQFRIQITLLTQSAAYEVALDYVEILPVVTGVFGI